VNHSIFLGGRFAPENLGSTSFDYAYAVNKIERFFTVLIYTLLFVKKEILSSRFKVISRRFFVCRNIRNSSKKL